MTVESKKQAEFDVEKIREDFPVLHQEVYGKPLVYLDNAATSQKPLAVIDTLYNYHHSQNANIHRGIFYLSEQATQRFEEARGKVQKLLNAKESKEIIFVRGTTEAINLVAFSFGELFVHEGDEILITHLEHHSNIVPWKMLCERKGAILKVVPMNEEGEIPFEEFKKLLSPKVKMFAVSHISNALGTIQDVKAMIKEAHKHDIPVLVDGAQAVPHMSVDVQDLDCEFYAFSGHKMFGPTGVGVLYGKEAWLEKLPPYQGGGDMISQVHFDKIAYNKLPYRFEAGTPNIAGVIGLGAAIDYIQKIGYDKIAQHEHELLEYAQKKLAEVPGIRFIGTAKHKTGVISFTLKDIHAHDIGSILDQEGVAIRAGHHCAMPVMDFFKVAATVRASFAFYNTKEEVDVLVKALLKCEEIFT